MKKLKKYAALMTGGFLLATLFLANGAVSLATPQPPQQPAATDCADCQSIQNDINAAYSELNGLIADIAAYDLESLLADTTNEVYEGNSALMVAQLTSKIEMNNLATDAVCNNSSNSFAYYSSFSYEGDIYCVLNESMWFGTDNFFETMMLISEVEAPQIAAEWAKIHIEMIELLMDYDGDQTKGIAEILNLIDSLLADLLDCEEENCPEEPECPDCETIATELISAINDLSDAESEADTLDEELTAIEEDLEKVFDQLEDLEQLREEFRQMVLDAGGKVDADCDGFKVQSGQAWGIAHNFGDVQWCLTSEGQIEEMINNLDEYWKTHKSSHLPSEEALNAQLDGLMKDYLEKLDEYSKVLDEILSLNILIEDLAAELDDCLAKLADLQAEGYCLDQDIEIMQDILDQAHEILGYDPGATPEADDGGFPDIGGHWAEDFINRLAGGGIVSGDDGTGNFRPDDSINRAEAAKIVSLGMGDTANVCHDSYFPDVLAGNWFCQFVTNAKDKGYFQGYDDGSFGPGNPILRAEAAAVVLRALEFDIPEYTSYSFPDVSGEEWYADYAEKAYLCGIFEGRTIGSEKLFAGRASITRAEFAKIIDVTVYGEMLDEAACE